MLLGESKKMQIRDVYFKYSAVGAMGTRLAAGSRRPLTSPTRSGWHTVSWLGIVARFEPLVANHDYLDYITKTHS